MRLSIQRVIKNWKFSHLINPDVQNFAINPAGDGRRFSYCNDPVYKIEAFKEFNLTPELEEPIYKNFIGNHYLDGAFVHDHKDDAPNGYVHVRCNVMLKKPCFGGDPVIDGELIHINENDMWICLSSLENHSSTPIRGGERIIFSFGSLISVEHVNKIIFK